MAIISITSNTLVAGGAERQRVYLANWLAQRGNVVALRLLRGRGPLDAIVSENVEIDEGWNVSGPAIDWLITGTTNTEVAFALKCMILGKAKRWSIAVHNPVSKFAPNLPVLPQLGFLFSHDVIALTSRHANEIEELWGVRATHIVPNGISVPSVRPLREEVRTLGYIGRLSIRHKGIDRVVSAMKVSPHLTLLVAGDGPDKSELSRLVHTHGLSNRVRFVGRVDPYEFYRQCSAILVLSRWEAQPLVLLEARWMGVPAVVSSEIAAHGDPFVVEGDDPDDVCRGISEALNAESVTPDESLSNSLEQMGLGYLAILDSEATRRGRLRSRRAFIRNVLRGRKGANAQ